MRDTPCISSPIYHVNLDSLTKELNPRLEKYIRNTGDEMERTSNIKADMTRYQTVCPEFTELHTIINPYISDLFIDQKPPSKISLIFKETWGALYKKGDYAIPHHHDPSKLSWIYYVKVSEKSTPLCIHNVANGGKEETAKIPPTISDLVVFPSWVEHSVPKQLIEEDRIVVAGNVDVI